MKKLKTETEKPTKYQINGKREERERENGRCSAKYIYITNLSSVIIIIIAIKVATKRHALYAHGQGR